jgi:hypothetical protein
LAVANVEALDCAVVEVLFTVTERKLAAALLWRFARFAKFAPAILRSADRLAELEARDLLKLLLVLVENPANRGAVARLAILPAALKRFVAGGDDERLEVVALLVRRVELTAEIVQRFEQAGVIAAFVAAAVAAGGAFALKQACYFADAVLHAAFAPSLLALLPAIAAELSNNAAFQKYALSVIVAFSFFCAAHARLAELKFADVLAKAGVVPENQGFVQALQRNLAVNDQVKSV